MHLTGNRPMRLHNWISSALLALLVLYGCGGKRNNQPAAGGHYDSLIAALSSTDSAEYTLAMQQVNDDLANNSAAIAPYHSRVAEALVQHIAQDQMIREAMYTLLLLKERGVRFSLGPKATAVLLKHTGNIHELALAAYRQNTSVWDNESYLVYREDLAALADLLGRGEPGQTDSLLHLLQDFPDRRVGAFAVSALLEQHKEPDANSLRYIAADIESRETLFSILQAHERSGLFPEKYKDQDSLALSVMVNWLTYPTELGRVPDAISVVLRSERTFAGSGPSLIYLIRFRSKAEDWKDKGWMAGLAGPFSQKDVPTTVANGYTFSKFEPLDEKHPEAQLDSLVSFMERNWERTP